MTVSFFSKARGALLRRLFLSTSVGLVGLGLASSCGHDQRPRVEASKGDSGCMNCHEGIEHMHPPLGETRCVVCHGGDGQATSKESAHVSVPADWESIRGDGLPPAPHGFIKDFSSDQLEKIDRAYLKFINPSDLRVAPETCGRCHKEQVATVPTSVMATNSGHYFPSLFLSGTQVDQEAYFGAQQITVTDCAEPGTSCELSPLRSPEQDEIESAIQVLREEGDQGPLSDVAYEHYLAKSCNTCHQSSYSRNDSPGLYRSSGCASCHVLYDEDGLYKGSDASIDSRSPVHPSEHALTRAIPTGQCASCHFQGGRIGLLFQGIREGGFADQPEFARTVDRPLYGHGPGFYIDDEDTRNDVDETPPDVHFELGMHCADCHVGSDVHGDGKLHASAKTQVDISCEDCHGNVREPKSPNGDGKFLTSKGRVLPQLRQDDEGRVILTGIVDGEEHVVPQPADILKTVPVDDPMRQAMAPNAHGWSHTDSLTCDACHTSYNQQCVGCHVTYDLRFDGVDGQTGLSTPGVAISKRGFTSLEQVLLGKRADGRIQSVVASQQVQLSVVGSEALGGDGVLLIGEEAGEDGWPRGEFRGRDGKPHLGFAPFFQHTTTARARTCESCHRKDDSDEELRRVRGVYGFGTGEFSIPGAAGSNIDPFQFLSENGEQLSPWQQPGTGAVPAEARGKALGVILSEM